ncbi:MAG: T9SS type A sorting domain-containing protein, partial [Nonlabens sp.]|nr:T9SS type A sorting domain-containing protein [Nonlabens sp.]
QSIGGSTATGQRYDFRGRPNNGTITLSVIADDFALVGNPYPSALDLKRFLEDNSNYAQVPRLDGMGIPVMDGMGNPVYDYVPGLTATIDAQILFWESKATSHQLTDYIGGYGSYVPGAFGNNADNGMYTPAAFSRYDSNGNPSGGSITGGSTGFAPPIGAGSSRRYAAIGQGFMIARTSTANGGVFAPSTTGSPVFSNSQRAFRREDASLSIFKSAPGSGAGNPNQTDPDFVRPKIYFSAAVNDLYVREFILAFGDDSTDGLDWGLEAVVDNNIQVNDMYMAQEGKKLVIKTIPFLETKKVPVSFVLRDPSTFEISIKSIQHFDTPFILLHDKQNGTVYDLKTSTATVALPAGSYNDRFEIVFEQPTTLSTGSEVLATAIDIFQNNDRQLLTILNPELKDIKNIALYDLAGRLIVSEKATSAVDNYTFNTATYSSGIYIVRVTDSANNETAVKVSIAN